MRMLADIARCPGVGDKLCSGCYRHDSSDAPAYACHMNPPFDKDKGTCVMYELAEKPKYTGGKADG